MLSTFVITLREGVEAALVVGIVLAYLNKANRSYLNPWVYAGIAAGILASVAIGTIFIGTLSSLDTTSQLYLKPLLEAIFGLIAIALLSWMLIWMTRQAKSLKGEVEQDLDRAIQTNAAWGIFGIIFFAVLREGFETVVFIAAQFQQGSSPVIGAIGGLCGATVIGILLFKLGIKINLKQFFQVMGILLLLIVSGLVIGVLAHLNKSLVLNPSFPCNQDSCILGGLIWDTSQVLPQKQFPGVILHTLFGYVDRLYWAEAIADFTFLTTIGTLYFRSFTEPKQEVPLESP
jgi:high-affinity iron transporter